jgi:hypothetical protein
VRGEAVVRLVLGSFGGYRSSARRPVVEVNVGETEVLPGLVVDVGRVSLLNGGRRVLGSNPGCEVCC